jgi:TPR repeat protein
LQPSSRNLDYLLDDDEEPKRGGGKLILVMLALALAAGFGYLHWKQGGFDWLNANDKKPAAAKPSPDAAQNPNSANSGTQPTPNGAAPQAGASDSGTTPTAPGSTPNPADSTAGQPTPSQTPPSQAPPSPNPAATNAPAPGDSSAPADSASQPASSDSAPSPSADTTPAPKSKARKPAPAKPAAAVPFDAVSQAERYIYGRGARQDCDHGMRLLKSAAEQSNPKAMISLGALYSTGTCTPRDLPTAYRWFALALHKQPDNQAVQDDLKNLWEKMTQPERQLAIKLSQ